MKTHPAFVSLDPVYTIRNMFKEILTQYGLDPMSEVEPLEGGLINSTWRVHAPTGSWILQRINNEIFKKPADISENIDTIANYLSIHHPGYFFVHPFRTVAGQSMVHLPEGGYFRMFPFIENSFTFHTASTPGMAYEAAVQFGTFTRNLEKLPGNKLKITLPGFHDLQARYEQFERSAVHGNAVRIKESEQEIQFIRSHDHIVQTYKQILSSRTFKQRITHHDTKISNVLFDASGKGICVIDLDTVMPGYFISDVGDMIRTYVSPVSEEEKDMNAIEVRDAYFFAIIEGYVHGMKGLLTEEEKRHFVYSGMFMIYMQAVRFLTDHFYNDKYYGAAYEGHNLVRAVNQITLLKRLIEKENYLDKRAGSIARGRL